MYKLLHKKLGLFYKDTDSYQCSFSRKKGKIFQNPPKPFSSPFLLLSKKKFSKTGLNFEECEFLKYNSPHSNMFQINVKKSDWKIVKIS